MRIAPLQRRAFLAGIGAAASLAVTSTRASPVDRDVAMAGWADIELLDSEDRRFRVDDVGQQFTLIRLWANWCSVCVRELPAMPALQAELARQNVELVLVSHPTDWARNQSFAHTLGLTVRSARPSANNASSEVQSALVSADGSFYVPRSLLYRHSTRSVVWSHVGSIDWTEPGAMDGVRRFTG